LNEKNIHIEDYHCRSWVSAAAVFLYTWGMPNFAASCPIEGSTNIEPSGKMIVGTDRYP